MDDDPEIRTASIQRDEPAYPHAESREETIARVVDEDEALTARRGGSTDPSSRRGLNRVLGWTMLRLAASGFVVGAAIALVLALLPGPFEVSGVASTIGYMIGLGAAAALVFMVIGSLLLLAREDGRVEREVERGTGRRPQGPGRPGSPEHDPTPR